MVLACDSSQVYPFLSVIVKETFNHPWLGTNCKTVCSNWFKFWMAEQFYSEDSEMGGSALTLAALFVLELKL